MNSTPGYVSVNKTLFPKGIYILMFIAVLWTIAKIWKQPKCLSTNEWIKKIWYMCVYINAVEHHSAVKNNEILSFA